VAECTGAAECQRYPMVGLDHFVKGQEVQSTRSTPPALPLEQRCPGAAELRVSSQATCPVHVVSVEWAGGACDLHAPPRGPPMASQRVPVGGAEGPDSFPRV